MAPSPGESCLMAVMPVEQQNPRIVSVADNVQGKIG
jgi:hypothetical protein